ncbi:MAG: rubrerythrin family protein [Chloroflexi bacterium]|nr:rubrerythrin family protein [Chloroflexota bacterium]MDA8216215.1 rubrerythrin family protein [Dehalococcoidales bacterium]
MHEMTERFLKEAFAGESQASMKYQLFADRAEKEHPNVARLFRALSFAERVHATNHLRALGGIKDTVANLETGAAGESFEIREMYPAYLAVAELQEEKHARHSMADALEAERVHLSLYEAAKAAVVSGSDATVGTLQICDVCGWTVEGEAPDICPLCKARKEHFKAF